MSEIRARRSCVNSVAHRLVDEMEEPTWNDLRIALFVAHIAVEECDMYRLFYGWPEVGEGITWTM